MKYPTIWPQFFTATIQNWKHFTSAFSKKEIAASSFLLLIENNKLCSVLAILSVLAAISLAALAVGAAAVSYTHLDVYKRQVQNRK